MKLEQFIERKLIEQKDKLNWNFQKIERKWFMLLDFQVPGNNKEFTGYLNRCLHGKIISKLIDRPLEFSKVYCFAGKMKMKLWIGASAIIEPVVAALEAAMDGLDKLSKDQVIFLEAITATSEIIDRRYLPMLDKANELTKEKSK